MKNKNILESFANAWQGVCQTALRERNFRAHIVLAILAVGACAVFKVDGGQFLWVAFSIFLVLCMELFNTAIEAITDLVCGDKRHPLAKIAKDAAAAAVLLASVLAVVVALAVALDVIKERL